MQAVQGLDALLDPALQRLGLRRSPELPPTLQPSVSLTTEMQTRMDGNERDNFCLLRCKAT